MGTCKPEKKKKEEKREREKQLKKKRMIEKKKRMIRKEERKKQKSTLKNEGKPSNPAPFTYPRGDPKVKPSPPYLQDRGREGPTPLYRSKRDKKREKSR